MMEPLTKEEQKVALKKEMDKTRDEVFIFGKQMEHYSNLAGMGKHSQRYLGTAGQLKQIVDEKMGFYEKLERDLDKLETE